MSPPAIFSYSTAHAASVPQGRSILAHPFKGGYRCANHGQAPQGRKKVRSFVLHGTPSVWGLRPPAINRWAILFRPSGLELRACPCLSAILPSDEPSGCPVSPFGVNLARPCVSIRRFRPAGTGDNSPPFQGWVPMRQPRSSPGGAKEDGQTGDDLSPFGRGQPRLCPPPSGVLRSQCRAIVAC
jgi:hypothetical protein